jgi:hypothetical protein
MYVQPLYYSKITEDRQALYSLTALLFIIPSCLEFPCGKTYSKKQHNFGTIKYVIKYAWV